MREIWVPAYNYEGWYEVSNLGCVKRVKISKGVKPNLILGIRKNVFTQTNQLTVKLTKFGRAKTILLRNLVFQSFVGALKEGDVVKFKDNNPNNCYLDNLVLHKTVFDLDSEVWKSVEHQFLKDNYEVSNFGRIRTIKPRRIIATYKAKSTGYLRITINRKKQIPKHRTFDVHALVARTFLGKPKKRQQVLHKDNNRTNACLDNLKYGTSKENNQQKIKDGTVACGERSGRVKITWKDVDEIRSTPEFFGCAAMLSRRFGIHSSQIRRIWDYRSWLESQREIGTVKND